jgi:hypothetical protein
LQDVRVKSPTPSAKKIAIGFRTAPSQPPTEANGFTTAAF